MDELFFELLRVAIGAQEKLSRCPSDEEWKQLWKTSLQHGLASITANALLLLKSTDQVCPRSIYLDWMYCAAKIKDQNIKISKRSILTQKKLAEAGFHSCILKGRSLAHYYGELAPYRQSSDIDVWMDGGIHKIHNFAVSTGAKTRTSIAHVEFHAFADLTVELHPQPAFLWCPWRNRRLQNWFEARREESFNNTIELDEGTITGPKTEFNIIFLLLHNTHHLLREGVGMRQYLDYYFLLLSDDDYNKEQLLTLINNIGLTKILRGTMWLLGYVFGLQEDKMLIAPDEACGRFMLKECMLSGNFGKNDERDTMVLSSSGFVRSTGSLKRSVRFLSLAPFEILSNPFWRIIHFCWRNKHGYED